MSDVPQIFVSATTSDLGSCRRAVAEVLYTLHALPIVQDHFPPDYRTVVDMLRAKIETCHAVICLVGRVYGQEPKTRAPGDPRRSYTQLEYDIAVELRKPVFVFIATDDWPGDTPDAAPESDELEALQLDHVKRFVGSDRLWMKFRSCADLCAQVREMRFDPESLARGISSRLAVILTAELANADSLRAQHGDVAWARDILQPYHEILRRTLIRWHGTAQSESPEECQVNFESADAAATAALELQHELRRHPWPNSTAPALRIGIDMGQVIRFGGATKAHMLQAGPVPVTSRRLASLARSGQILLSRAAFDNARAYVRELPFAGLGTAAELSWAAYGRYIVKGAEEPLEICEVGVKGEAPLAAPPESNQVERADSLEERAMRGWRPAVAQEIPRRSGWFIEKKLGEGGFGEVWVARHEKTREHRVFKFCFEATRLSSFKRELTLFRLLKTALGHRDDIASLLEVELDQPPFYLESEYVKGGNLREWAETGSGLAGVPLEERLRLMARIARAVAAAHSVGIIHKDLKPSNIFMRPDTAGRSQPMLADFGIGAVADRSVLLERGITVAGFTQSVLEPGSSRTGTRMYQPPESQQGRVATVQGDVYALGVMLFQILVGNFDQPLGVGWERRLESARQTEAHQGGEAPAEAPQRSSLARVANPRGQVMTDLLKQDINDCVIDDPAQRLASAAQLAERLETLDARVTALETRRKAERSVIRMRRLRTALAASLIALLSVGGLAVFAVTQWRRAESLKKAADNSREIALAHKNKAEENEKKARASAGAARQQSRLALGTLHAVIHNIQRDLQTLPGSSPIRSRLLGTALRQLETLSGEYAQQSVVDRETMASLNGMADIILQLRAAPATTRAAGARELSQVDAKSAVESARRLYARASEIAQALAKAEPNDAQAKRDVSLSYVNLGDAHLHLGSIDTALGFYRLSLEHRESLVEADPQSALDQRELAVSYERVGDLRLRLGSTDKALILYRKALELRETLAKAEPKNAVVTRDLSVGYEKLGDLQLKIGSTDKALEFYRKSLELRETLVKADSNDAQAKRDLSISYINLGDLHQKLGSTDKALEFYRESLELHVTLAKADPNDARAKRDLSISYDNLGDVHLKLGSTDKALEFHRAGLALRETLAQADPNDAEAKRDLAISYDNVGDVTLRLGSIDRAIEFYRKSLELRETLVKAEPNDAEVKRDLSISYDRLGDVNLRLGSTDEALEFYRKGLELRETLTQADPNDSQAKRDVSLSYERLADLHLKHGSTDKALEFHRKRLKLSEALVKADPNDAQAKRDLRVSYTKLGDLHLKVGSIDKAIEFCRQGLALSEALAKADPNDAHHKRDLCISYDLLGDVQVKLGSNDKALEFYNKGLELREALAKADPNDARAKRDLSISCDKLDEVHLKLGSTAEALEFCRKGLELRMALAKAEPNDAQAKRDLWVSYERLGDVHLKLGSTDKALEFYRKALELSGALAKTNPADLQAQQDLSNSLYTIGQALERSADPAQARAPYEQSLAVDREISKRIPGSATARRKVAVDLEILSKLCQRLNDWPAAVNYARQSLEHAQAARQIAGQTRPFEWDFSVSFTTLANAQQRVGQIREARQSYEEALKIQPGSIDPLSNFAWLLATTWDDSCRDGQRAIALASKACELTGWKHPVPLDTLAAAHAEAGHFDEAVKWQQKTLEQAKALPAATLEELKSRMKLYESHRPYREPKPAPTPAINTQPSK